MVYFYVWQILIKGGCGGGGEAGEESDLSSDLHYPEPTLHAGTGN